MSRPAATTRQPVERFALERGVVERRRQRDTLATEEPLEIRVTLADGSVHAVAVTMRTPGADFELASGFLFGEAAIQEPGDLVSIRYCVDRERDGAQQYNIVSVSLSRGARFDPAMLRRNFYTTSSCGVCGKASIDAVLAPACTAPVRSGGVVDPVVLLSLPARLRDAQVVFQKTGGLHAAALFTGQGELVRVREDVGRHNAMDKLVGASLLAGELPLERAVVLVSGRLSFELVQKAARAGVAVLAGISAPSSLAVGLAERAGLTLIGFLRDGGFNVYSGSERLGAGRLGSGERGS